jgi:hypothetical protein
VRAVRAATAWRGLGAPLPVGGHRQTPFTNAEGSRLMIGRRMPRPPRPGHSSCPIVIGRSRGGHGKGTHRPRVGQRGRPPGAGGAGSRPASSFGWRPWASCHLHVYGLRQAGDQPCPPQGLPATVGIDAPRSSNIAVRPESEGNVPPAVSMRVKEHHQASVEEDGTWMSARWSRRQSRVTHPRSSVWWRPTTCACGRWPAVGERQTAEAIARRAFVEAWRELPSTPQGTSFAPWLFATHGAPRTWRQEAEPSPAAA